MNITEYINSNFNIMSSSQVTTLGLAYDYGKSDFIYSKELFQYHLLNKEIRNMAY